MKTKQILQEWEEKELKELCNIVSGSTPKTSNKEYWGGNIFWITPKDLSKYNEKYIFKTARTITQKGYDSCSARMIEPNNVLMSSRAPIGYLVINKVPICTNQGFKSFIIKNNSLNPEYLYYYLKSIVEKIKNTGSGTTFNELSKTKAGLIKIKFPPLPLQKQIVQAIETQFVRLDKAIKSLKAVKQKIEVYRKAVLKKAFEKAEGWREVELNKLTEKITDGTHFTPKYIEKGIKFISVKDVRNDKIYFDNCKFISQEEHNKLIKRCHPKRGDLLITKSGTIGRTAIVDTDEEFSLFVSVALIKLIKNVLDSKFLMYFIQKYINSIDVSTAIKGTAVKNFHLEDMRKLKIPKLSIQQQKKITSQIESKFSVIDKVEQVVNNSLKKTEMLKKSILKSAFEGRLVKQGI